MLVTGFVQTIESVFGLKEADFEGTAAAESSEPFPREGKASGGSDVCMAGLRDQSRPGKKPRYGEELRRRVLRQLELPPPPGLAGWDGGTLAAALGVSDAAVWRVLRKDGIQLRRHRSWCVSTDPQFAAKAADIVGL